jgi:hypothetical protein
MAEVVKVKPGQTISDIAAKAKVSVAAIAAANPSITNLSKINIGQVITIPVVDTTVKTAGSTYAGGLTGGTNPFATGSKTSQATLDKLTGASGITPGMGSKTPGTDGGIPAANTVVGSNSVDNGDGTYTVTTTYADGKGGTYQQVTQSGTAIKPVVKDTSLTDRTLASDTFVNTFALVFGKTEAAQPYVKQLYTLVSGFYKSGSSIDESLNLAIRQARQDKVIPEFTKRFAGLFALEDKFNAGMAVEVPTIAEFFAAEAKMGDLLNQAGLNDLATQEFLGGVIGQGKSVATVANLISDAFNTIDTAPTALRADLNTYFPSVSRTSLAKAILTGEKGAKALSDEIKGISVLSAAKSQGVSGVGLDYAQNLANMGIDYQEALTGFGQVKNLERGNTLAQFGGGTFTSAQAQKAVFEKNIEEQNRLDLLKELEQGRFQGGSGTTTSSLKSPTLGQY